MIFGLQAEEEKINREKQLEQEERMAKELARINHETQRDEKLRQYIIENRYFITLTYFIFWINIQMQHFLLLCQSSLLKLIFQILSNTFQHGASRAGVKAEDCICVQGKSCTDC